MTNKGFATYIILAVVGVLILGGVVAYTTQPSDKEEGAMMEDKEHMTEDAMMDKEDEAVMEHDGEMMEEKDGDVMMEKSATFEGIKLAGSTSLLLDFNEKDYEKALATKKLVVLFFYANWCPTCKAEFPKMQQVFDELTSSEVVGFRVNFNDNETSPREEELAREFGVAYQHTKVILKNGERVLKAPNTWSKDMYLEEITSQLGI